MFSTYCISSLPVLNISKTSLGEIQYFITEILVG
uniref:Uncharacterized protein n=1 Tax=Siphoviridae sp. ct2vX3 TaxID=2825318 RepID=A0A8S5PZA2_9CAUD|nr:MAG TPA: hypothetical protein [Siphoviridae sp. ct2vX3]